MILKKIFICITTGLITVACTRSNNNLSAQQLSAADSAALTVLSNLFSITDAEKIIGEPAHIIQHSVKREGNVLTYQSGYKANAENYKTPDPGVVYFLVEQYSDVAAAQKKYSLIKTANETHEGVKTVDDLGDEAYFHSDGENFYFIMVRKDARVFNMKVNKITRTTSLEEFNTTAKKITAGI